MWTTNTLPKKKGINGWTGEPKGRYYEFRKWDKNIFSLTIVCLLISACAGDDNHVSVSPEAISKYEDTTVSVYGPYRVYKLPISKGVKILNPLHISSGPDGKLFAANQSGEIYTLKDSDGDGIEDETILFSNVADYGLRSPAGFAYRGDTVYIGTAQEIRAFIDQNNDGKSDTSWTFYNKIPFSQHPYEWTCAMNFAPDGWLYCALSTDSWNDGASPDPNGFRGSIVKISPDGKQAEKVATGIRSVYGSAFNHKGDFFFTDNEGGGNPREELNQLIVGGFYGHNPKKYPGHNSVSHPALPLEVEVAPSAMTFNRSDNHFGGTGDQLFIAFYGPGERWTRGGVGRVVIEQQADGRYSFKEFPVADIPKLSGLTFGNDGALYLAHHGVSDYWYNSTEEKTGGFYKMVYDASLADRPVKQRQPIAQNFTERSLEAGKQLFAEQACSACHGTTGGEELIGPNLNGIASRLSRENILEDIQYPSKIIKPSMGAMKITKIDGQVLLGRVVNSNEQEISLMLIGNKVVNIPRKEIQKTENENKSLMYEGLVKNLSEVEINSLLDYISSLK